jgi:hypothetical protein
MKGFVIRLPGNTFFGENRVLPPLAAKVETGWRKYVWVRRLRAARVFMSEAGAYVIARATIPHDEWEVAPLEDILNA